MGAVMGAIRRALAARRARHNREMAQAVAAEIYEVLMSMRNSGGLTHRADCLRFTDLVEMGVDA